MSFIVITATPDPKSSTGLASGNLACPIGDLYYQNPDDPIGPASPMPLETQLAIRTPVFGLGEILVTDEGGREIGGAERKPAKWWIEWETFENVEEAIARSHEVTGR